MRSTEQRAMQLERRDWKRGLSLLCVCALAMNGRLMSAESSLWKFLAPLPVAIAGQCVGTVGDALVVAGGSSWTAPPWNGGVKNWSKQVYALRSLDGQWQTETVLPRGMGYGASAQWGESLLCVGGQDGTRVFDNVLRFHSVNGKIVTNELPKLPKPLTNAAAAVVNDTLFVMGGQHGLAPDSVSNEMWRLPLNGGEYGKWKLERPPRRDMRAFSPWRLGARTLCLS